MTLRETDIAVVGGGIIGAALAIGLAQQGFNITLVERVPPKKFNPFVHPDVRILALGMASIDLLRKLGVWDIMCTMRMHPYRIVETWEWEKAHVIFDSSELKLPQLGYMVETNVLQQALWQVLKMHSNVTLCVPSSLTTLRPDKQGYHLVLSNGDELAVKLVVGSDGTNSQVREMTNIDMYIRQYYQICMSIIVKCEYDPGDSTWQHFTPTGPHAFLPLFDHWALLVWYDKPIRIYQLDGLSLPQLKYEIVSNFPDRLGKITPVMTRMFPLTCCHATHYVQKGVVLVGDAAHTIHPLAGQGVNLGYRDVSVLLNVIRYARDHDEPWASKMVLTRYERERMINNFIMQMGMELFYIGFCNNCLPIQLLRNIGLMVAERASSIKLQVLKYVLGL